MGFKLTSMSRVFVFPDKPDTVDTIPFFTGTEFFETGETFGTPPNDWVKVQLSDSAVQGWLKRSSGIEVPDPPRPSLDEEGFVRSALLAESSFNEDPGTSPNFVFADYVLALAFVESGMTNAGPAPPPSDGIGPLQVTTATWQEFKTKGKPFSDIFDLRDRPSAQAYCAAYRMREDGRAIRAALPQGGGQTTVTLLDVFHAYLTGSAAVAVAIKNATAADKATAPDVFNAGLSRALVITIFDKLQKLVLGSTQPANLGQLIELTKAALEAALQKAFDLIKVNAPDQLPPAPKEKDPGDQIQLPQGPGNAPASNLNYSALRIPQKFRPFGDLIVARFSDAGYGRNHQVAAVANAIAESNLNPQAVAGGGEQSFGLFQCNIHGGLGNGFTKDQLFDPDTNIAIILREAKRHKDFADATTLEAAVEAFVRDIERPANAPVQVAKRITTAHKLIS
ncbi:phage tail tip lysozyme [Bradyrhizobium sp. LA2.1]|uniref:phage tail tip lysozyme n=1 Tax=Bradyrhizobium sp. LA2.1 TaxID=3156376 RepID=UPI003391C24F